MAIDPALVGAAIELTRHRFPGRDRASAAALRPDDGTVLTGTAPEAPTVPSSCATRPVRSARRTSSAAASSPRSASPPPTATAASGRSRPAVSARSGCSRTAPTSRSASRSPSTRAAGAPCACVTSNRTGSPQCSRTTCGRTGTTPAGGSADGPSGARRGVPPRGSPAGPCRTAGRHHGCRPAAGRRGRGSALVHVRLHCWLGPPLQVQISRRVPLAVPRPVASRHLPEGVLTTVPSGRRLHCWAPVPLQS